jgi:site-specific recombinase
MSIHSILHEIKFKPKFHPYLLRQLVSEVKKSAQRNEGGLQQLIDELQKDIEARAALKMYIKHVFKDADLTYVLTSSGIFYRTGFTSEIIRKIKHSILPEAYDKRSFHYLLLYILPGKRDDKWLYGMFDKDIVQLNELLDLKLDFTDSFLNSELLDAIEVLSYRMTATVLESEFHHTFRDNEALDAFVRQNKEVHTLIAQHTLGIQFNPHLVTHIKQLLDDALHNIKLLKKLSGNRGASLQFTYTLHRLTQQIERMKILFNLYLHPEVKEERLSGFIKFIVKNEKDKNRVSKQLNETIYLLAYQIAEHESKTGEHYIAGNKKEYRSMFSSSCGGGFIAVAMTFIKILLHHLPFAPFWQAFVYSLNYAAGFVGVQVTHSTLATKQPAMTASKIAHSLDRNNSAQVSIPGLALMIGKVWRSQFISFAGNLLIVFPISFLIAWCYLLITGHHIVNIKEAEQMMHDVHPWKNPTWFFAGITGVFLFLSGIISGFYDNKVIYSNIPERIRQHHGLRKILPKRSLVKFSRYVEHNLGSLIGNICLGFLLGSAAFFGYILGLPFDIRHITISSGNYSIALFTLLPEIPLKYALICLVGVLGIGVFNFVISFGLALFVAAKSRKVHNVQLLELIKWTFIYFKKYPKDFFFPPKNERSIEELINDEV